MKDKKIRIVIADDHMLVRIGLRTLIAGERDMTCVGEAENGKEAVQLAKELKPDVIVMDLMMPVVSGSDATRLILKILPKTLASSSSRPTAPPRRCRTPSPTAPVPR